MSEQPNQKVKVQVEIGVSEIKLLAKILEHYSTTIASLTIDLVDGTIDEKSMKGGLNKLNERTLQEILGVFSLETREPIIKE